MELNFESARLFYDVDDERLRNGIEFVLKDSTDRDYVVNSLKFPNRIFRSKYGDGSTVYIPTDYKEFIECLKSTEYSERIEDINLTVINADENSDCLDIDSSEYWSEDVSTVYPGYCGIGLCEYAAEALVDESLDDDAQEELKEKFLNRCNKVLHNMKNMTM